MMVVVVMVMMVVMVIMMVVMVVVMMMIILSQNHRSLGSSLVRRLLRLGAQDIDRIRNWVQQFRE